MYIYIIFTASAAGTAKNHHCATAVSASNKHCGSSGATEFAAAATTEAGVCAYSQQ